MQRKQPPLRDIGCGQARPIFDPMVVGKYRKLIAALLVVLFAAFILPKDLLHSCKNVHASHAIPGAENGQVVKSSCGICDTPMPTFQAEELLVLVRIATPSCAHYISMQQEGIFGSRSISSARGPPQLA